MVNEENRRLGDVGLTNLRRELEIHLAAINARAEAQDAVSRMALNAVNARANAQDAAVEVALVTVKAASDLALSAVQATGAEKARFYEQQFDALSEKTDRQYETVNRQLAVLTSSMDTLAGRGSGVSTTVALMLSVVGVLIAIAVFFSGLRLTR
jgi:hypothetical protein